MRILSIRGSNITSLAGEFRLDLDKAPLAGVGLFSITGPTGAGKSSLLDALCLALFGTAPRLDGQGSMRIGRDDDAEDFRLGIGDPRSLVRRGASSAFAEVEYVGEGGHRYRARWEARRARNLVTGKFQDWTLQLTNLDDEQRLGTTKKDVQKEIERTLGLSYQQFRRSALLAQGDFAAFLQEKGDERAKLLEQMTGADIYKRISMAAFQRAKEAEAELRRLDDAIGAVPTLDDEARAKLEASRGTLTTSRDELEKKVAKLESSARWFDDLSKLTQLESDARQEQQLASKEHEALSPLREELLQFERALPLRPFVNAEQDAKRKQEQALAKRTQAEAQVAIAKAALDQCRQSLATSQQAERDASDRLTRARPELLQASKLDALIREKEQQAAQAREQAKDADAKRDQTAGQLLDLTARIDDQKKLTEETRAWLEHRKSVAPLEAQWDLFQAELRRFIEAHREAKAAEAAAKNLQATQSDAQRALDAAHALLEEARKAAESAKSAWEQLERETAEAGFSEANRQERDALVARQAVLESMKTLALQAEELAKREADERTGEASARLHAEEARREASEAEATSRTTEIELNEATRAFEQTRMTLDLAGHRESLREGEPCPLCGSQAHPYAQQGGPVAALLEAHRARVSDLQARRSDLSNTQSSKRATALELEKAAQQAAARAQGIAAQREGLRAKWATYANESGIVADNADARGLEAVRELAATVEARLRLLRDAEKRSADLAKEAQQRQKAWQVAHTTLEAATRALEGAKEKAREASDALLRNDEKLARATSQLDEAANALSPAFLGREGWRAKLDEDPEVFAKRRAKEVAEYRGQRESLTKLEQDLAKSSAEHETTKAILKERTETASKLAGDVEAREGALSEDRLSRSKLLDGRPTEEVRVALEGALAEATATLQSAQTSERDAQLAATGAMQELTAAQTAEAIANESLQRACSELASQLAAIGMERELLGACLAREEAWISATKLKLAALDKTLRESAMRLDERTRSRRTHEELGRPELAEEATRADLSAARESLQSTIDGLAAAQAELRRDDDARKQRADRNQALEDARKAAERWKALDQLIGSADGKKFRVFAQSLTLDGLVAYANEHLRDLAPRYRLMRVPGHDMELQVIDGDMGDEVRGTNSLSGGETFLVSLALALALSSLAARDVRIDTLFVDEGFGSLDPATLDVAIAALESLQATGRQVGVISHVRALADKIGMQVRVQRLGAGRSRLVVGDGMVEASAG